jgi:hypothetical protein
MPATKILWGQIITVFAIVLLAIWTATEWTAWRLGFQPGLGRPWFELLHFPFYLPPAFFWWWYAYDAYAPSIFIEGAYIASSGGLIAAAVAIGMSVWRAREASHESIPARDHPAHHQRLDAEAGSIPMAALAHLVDSAAAAPVFFCLCRAMQSMCRAAIACRPRTNLLILVGRKFVVSIDNRGRRWLVVCPQIEVAGVVPFMELACGIAHHSVDHAPPLSGRTLAYQRRPALQVLVVLHPRNSPALYWLYCARPPYHGQMAISAIV